MRKKDYGTTKVMNMALCRATKAAKKRALAQQVKEKGKKPATPRA